MGCSKTVPPGHGSEQLTGQYRLTHGDCLAGLQAMKDNSVDSIVTDPPYGLNRIDLSLFEEVLLHWLRGDRAYSPQGSGFMGQSWDSFVPPPAVWDELFRVLKPGGHMLTFSAPRTQDIMGLSIRLGGFEIFDNIAWINAQGFPKTAGTTLKPAVEPIIFARKPRIGSVKANHAKYGTGLLNIDENRVPYRDQADESESKAKSQHGDSESRRRTNNVHGDYSKTPAKSYNPPGRYPTNVILDDLSANALDEQSGVSRSRKGRPRQGRAGEGWGMSHTGTEHDDQGGASRFFFVAKATPAERRAGLDGKKNPHTTVKPLALMRHLVRLVTPEGGTVIDPFTGSGTTGVAAVSEHMNFIGFEQDLGSFLVAQRRLQHALQGSEQ